MEVKNRETAERFAKKRRELKELYNLLANYTRQAEVTVSVNLPYAVNGDKKARIQNDTFNALMAKLVEDEIANIAKFVESL